LFGDGSTKTMKDGLDGWLMVVILVFLFPMLLAGHLLENWTWSPSHLASIPVFFCEDFVFFRRKTNGGWSMVIFKHTQNKPAIFFSRDA